MQINRHLVIATRSSALALAQTQLVANAISSTISSSALLQLTTEGDKKLDTPLFESGGKGLFIKELEQALLDKKADLAVHSLKDMPLIGHPELINCYYLGQSSPLDVLVSQFSSLDELPYGATVGTSSIRRATQLKLLRNDLKIKLLRGNVLTRLEKLQEGNFDAIILAAAGLKRLNKLDPKYTPFSVQEMTPAFHQLESGQQ